jgi:hypothetical protein
MDLGWFSFYICSMCNILANIRSLMDKDLSMCMRSIIKICITNPCKTTFKGSVHMKLSLQTLSQSLEQERM